MNDPHGDSTRLDEEAARHLLQRATELDASIASQSSVADLREAARSAGISDEAFQRALEEVRAAATAHAVRQKQVGTFPPRRLVKISLILLIVGAVVAVFGARLRNGGAAPGREIGAPGGGVIAPVAPPPTRAPPPPTPPPRTTTKKQR
jgi:septal ring factor EnvC (AmiA/AmiB activator)